MDPLQLLANATGTPAASPKETIVREVVKGAVFAALGLAWAIVLVAMIALTAVLALEPEVGAPQAAAITTGGFVIVALIAALALRGRSTRTPAPPPVPAHVRGGSLAENGDMLKVRSGWDVATLVALGVLAGLQRRQPH